MPIYEYACKKCENKFEHLAKSMADADAKVKCPQCGSMQTHRALSVFAVASGGQKSAPEPSMCQRCGGDGPCPMQEG